MAAAGYAPRVPDVGDDWEDLVEGLREGDPERVNAFVRTFGPALERLAARAIHPGMQRRFGPESIAMSVCRTFLRRAHGGEFDLPDADAVWRLLCAIALNKVRKHTRFHLRERRRADREVPIDWARRERDPVPTPEDLALFADSFAAVVDSLDPGQRRMLELRLAARSHREIAQDLRVSQRTVRRHMAGLETRLRSALGA